MAILRVLIVDDNPMLLGMITDIVGEFGHAPIAVSTADAAIEALSGGDFDVLLTDIALGHGVSGIDLILNDRVVMPPAVVLMSGNPEPDGLPRGTRFISKPFTIRVLEQALRS